ncbi:hypothetical protein D3C86_1014080 [compost metagenome]
MSDLQEELESPEHQKHRESLSISIGRIRAKIKAHSNDNRVFWDAMDIEEVDNLLSAAEWSIVDFLTPFTKRAEEWKREHQEKLEDMKEEYERRIEKLELQNKILNQAVYTMKLGRKAEANAIADALGFEDWANSMNQDELMHDVVRRLEKAMKYIKHEQIRTKSTKYNLLVHTIREALENTWADFKENGHET